MTRYKRSYINEDRTYKNMKRARDKYLKPKGYNDDECKEASDFLKRTVPNVKNLECHFIEGVTRMYANGELDNSDVRDKVNQVLGYLTTTDAWNEFGNTPEGRNLNGLSAQQLISTYTEVLKDAKNADEENLSKQDFGGNNGYDIVLIDSFEKAQEYSSYTTWCVTTSENAYDNYTKGGVFYFCLKNGFENVERLAGSNAPLDEYGLSMIAVSIYPDGSCNTITCRWNHRNGGSDKVMTTEELSKAIGENFYDVFKPIKRTITLDDKEYFIGVTEDGFRALYDEQGHNILGNGVDSYEIDKRVSKILGCDALLLKADGERNCLIFKGGKTTYLFDEWFDYCNCYTVLNDIIGIPCFQIEKEGKFNYVLYQDERFQQAFNGWFDCFRFEKVLSDAIGNPCFELKKESKYTYAVFRDTSFHYLFDEWFDFCWFDDKLSKDIDELCFIVAKSRRCCYAKLQDGKLQYLFKEWFESFRYKDEVSKQLGVLCFGVRMNDKCNIVILRKDTQEYMFDEWFDELYECGELSNKFGTYFFYVRKDGYWNCIEYKDGSTHYILNQWVEFHNLADEIKKQLNQNNECRTQRLSSIITEMVIKRIK